LSECHDESAVAVEDVALGLAFCFEPVGHGVVV
jgi:hypothetical protein